MPPKSCTLSTAFATPKSGYKFTTMPDVSFRLLFQVLNSEQSMLARTDQQGYTVTIATERVMIMSAFVIIGRDFLSRAGMP